MKIGKTIAYIVFVFVFLSCGSNDKTTNTYVIKRSIGDIEYHSVMLSTNKIIDSRIERGMIKANANLDSIKQLLDNETHFIVQFRDNSLGTNIDLTSASSKNYQDYQKKIESAHFSLESHFSIEVKDDRIPATISVFENAFNNSPYKKFYVVFSNTAERISNESFTLVFNDFINNKGKIKFRYLSMYSENNKS